MRWLIPIFGLVLAGQIFAQDGWRLETPGAPWDGRDYHNSVVFNTELWIFGGYSGTSGNNTHNGWATSDGATWNLEYSYSGPPDPLLVGSVLQEFNGELWSLGGGYTNKLVRSPDGVNWTQELGAPWLGRTSFAGVVFNGKMWIFGGEIQQTSNYLLNDVWSTTDGVNWTQETAAANWSPRNTHTATVFNNRMWIIGGGDMSGGLNDVWSSADGVNWVRETASAPWGIRGFHRTVVYRDRLWVIGGIEVRPPPVGVVEYHDVWSSSDGVNWVEETDFAPWAEGDRAGFTVAAFDNRIWLTGGGTTTTGLMNDVWSYGLHIAPDDLPDGVVDGMYSADFEAQEGDGPFNWTHVSGQLPPGMTLDTSGTSDTIHLAGTPRVDGLFIFTIRLEDNDGNVIEQDYTLTVISPPSDNDNGAGESAGTGCTAAPGGLPWLILYGALTLGAVAILRRRACPE